MVRMVRRVSHLGYPGDNSNNGNVAGTICIDVDHRVKDALLWCLYRADLETCEEETLTWLMNMKAASLIPGQWQGTRQLRAADIPEMQDVIEHGIKRVQTAMDVVFKGLCLHCTRSGLSTDHCRCHI